MNIRMDFMGRYLCSKKRSKECQASQSMINTPIAKTNFLIIRKASEISLGSHFGTQLTAVITVSGCICLHFSALFPSVTAPLHLSRWATVEMNKKNPFDRSCLEFQCPLAKFITLRKKALCQSSQTVLSWWISVPTLCCLSAINRKCQSCMQQIFRKPI